MGNRVYREEYQFTSYLSCPHYNREKNTWRSVTGVSRGLPGICSQSGRVMIFSFFVQGTSLYRAGKWRKKTSYAKLSESIALYSFAEKNCRVGITHSGNAEWNTTRNITEMRIRLISGFEYALSYEESALLQ